MTIEEQRKKLEKLAKKVESQNLKEANNLARIVQEMYDYILAANSNLVKFKKNYAKVSPKIESIDIDPQIENQFEDMERDIKNITSKVFDMGHIIEKMRTAVRQSS